MKKLLLIISILFIFLFLELIYNEIKPTPYILDDELGWVTKKIIK